MRRLYVASKSTMPSAVMGRLNAKVSVSIPRNGAPSGSVTS
jgi:hypothetical protein